MLSFIFIFLPLYFITVLAQSTHEHLVDLAAQNNGLIKLNSQTWDLLMDAKRTWSVTVQLTALDKKMSCVACRQFNPSFNAVAKAWSTVSKSERDTHFFATLDFADGQDVFRKLGVATAPIVSIYPAVQGPRRPTNGKVDPINYDTNTYGDDAKMLAEQLSNYTPIPIPYRAPINWGFFGTVLITAVASAVVIRQFLSVFTSRWTWAFVTIFTSLVMTSGFMFVRIRGMPYRTATQTMLPGYQTQVGQEIWTISFTYAFLGCSYLALTVLVPRNKSEIRQRFGIYAFAFLNIFIFSLLLSFFKIKNGGYPFKLLM